MCRVNKEPGEAFARSRAGDASSQGVQHAVWCQASDATGTGPAAEPGARWGPVVCGRRVRSCDAGGGRPQRCSEPGERRAPRARPSCGWLRARRRVARRRRAAPRLRPMGLWTVTLTPCGKLHPVRAGGRCPVWLLGVAGGERRVSGYRRGTEQAWWMVAQAASTRRGPPARVRQRPFDRLRAPAAPGQQPARCGPAPASCDTRHTSRIDPSPSAPGGLPSPLPPPRQLRRGRHVTGRRHRLSVPSAGASAVHVSQSSLSPSACRPVGGPSVDADVRLAARPSPSCDPLTPARPHATSHPRAQPKYKYRPPVFSPSLSLLLTTH